MVHRHFMWTDRSSLPLAVGFVLGSWALLVGLFAIGARLLGAGPLAASAVGIAVGLTAGAFLLSLISAVVGWVVERPARPRGETVPLPRSHDVSGRAA